MPPKYRQIHGFSLPDQPPGAVHVRRNSPTQRLCTGVSLLVSEPAEELQFDRFAIQIALKIENEGFHAYWLGAEGWVSSNADRGRKPTGANMYSASVYPYARDTHLSIRGHVGGRESQVAPPPGSPSNFAAQQVRPSERAIRPGKVALSQRVANRSARNRAALETRETDGFELKSQELSQRTQHRGVASRLVSEPKDRANNDRLGPDLGNQDVPDEIFWLDERQATVELNDYNLLDSRFFEKLEPASGRYQPLW